MSIRSRELRIREWPNLKAAVANSLRIPGLQLESYSVVKRVDMGIDVRMLKV